MFHSIQDSSAGCTCISELIFTLGLELSTILIKRHHIIHLSTESVSKYDNIMKISHHLC
ncbi:unnamed protein product [Schistosoma margrebowiei]|uniref:Uncharacterized protein n=1 Tax=Schistosoma margrebowiei TaxID=48269 RepID=A0A183MEH8_9TREM|nr:unnamed protein product [Schistosoma margrebowiei]